MLALIACLALAQAPPDLAPLRDAAFTAAQEAWVYAAARPLRYDGPLTGAEARLLRVLDCGHFDCRELAAERLRAVPVGRRAAVLYWGQRSRSASVASLCKTMYEALYRCPHCEGSGQCPVVGPCALCFASCRPCDGTGDLRLAWGWEQDGGTVASNRIFGP